MLTTSTYDANGNLTCETNRLTLAYNVLNQTGSVTSAGQGAHQYTYNGPNEAQRVAVNGTAVRYSKLGLYQRNPTDVFFRDNSGLLLAAGLGVGGYYYLFDALGSVVGLTDISGNRVQSCLQGKKNIGYYMAMFGPVIGNNKRRRGNAPPDFRRLLTRFIIGSLLLVVIVIILNTFAQK